jgi:hypothetical protein
MSAIWKGLLAIVVIAVWFLLTTQSHAAECLNKSEAHAKYHNSHIWWHGEERCWDDNPRRKVEVSVEKASTETKEATVYFPEFRPGLFGFAVVMPLSWSHPWYSPRSIATWPPMIDVDRVPFTAWTKRVGE